MGGDTAENDVKVVADDGTEQSYSNQSEPMLPTISETTDWKSIYLAGLCSFIQATQFSIFFTSMYQYILTLVPDVTQKSFGFVVTAYSLSQAICSPIFGWWSNTIGEVRLPLIVGFLIMALGNLVYLSLQYFTDHHLIVMMVARLVAGGGTGNMSLLRAYASTASTSQDRSRAVACVSGGIAIGSMIGPGLQLMFTPLGEDGINILGVNVSIYTCPALLCLCLNFLGLSMVSFVFEEKQILNQEKNLDRNEETGETKIKTVTNPDIVAIMLCVVTRFSQIFLNTTHESIGSAYMMMMFGFEKEESVSVNSGLHTITGMIAASIFITFIFTNVRKYVKNRVFTSISLILPLLWLISTYPYSFYNEHVSQMINGSDANCDMEKYTWCSSLHRVPELIYFTGYIITYGISYSLMNITVTTIYSKVIGPRPQGTYQGIYQMAGSFGRMIAPLLMSFTYSLYGPSVPWLILIVNLGILNIVWIILRGRMVPFEKYRSNKIQ